MISRVPVAATKPLPEFYLPKVQLERGEYQKAMRAAEQAPGSHNGAVLRTVHLQEDWNWNLHMPRGKGSK